MNYHPRVRLSKLLTPLAVGVLAAAACFPVWDRWMAVRDAERRLEAARARLAERTAGDFAPDPIAACAVPLDPENLLRTRGLEPLLASWATVGGCGVGASSGASGGGIQWVGRGVTGGVLNIESIGTHSDIGDNSSNNLNTRMQVNLGRRQKWSVGVGVPLMYNTAKVQRPFETETRTAKFGALGDISLLGTYKLGLLNATSITLTVGLPTGAPDVAREGVLLPMTVQPGSNKVSGSLMLQHLEDQDWGPIILGASVGWRGGENYLKDYRAPSGSTFAYVGYVLGAFVPSTGLSLNLSFKKDRERGRELDQRQFTLGPFAGIEWSSDYLAILLAGSPSLSFQEGMESWTVGLGLTTSIF